MKNLFDQDSYNEIIERINKLSPGSQRQWGKMQVAQMMAHCKEAFKVPLSDKKLSGPLLAKIFGRLIKAKLYNDSPWKKGLPTAPNFVIKDDRDFDTEKKELLDLVNRFHQAGPGNVGKHPHPFFGRFTAEQWGMSMYKHLDHHLRQFAA